MRGRRASDASLKDYRRRDDFFGRVYRFLNVFNSAFSIFLLCFLLFSAAALCTFRRFGASFRPVLIPTWRNPTMNAISGENPISHRGLRSSNIHSSPTCSLIEDAVSLPDQVIIFLKPQPLPSLENCRCIYILSQSVKSYFSLPALSMSSTRSFVRCPLPPEGHVFNISLSVASIPSLPSILPHHSDHLVYASVFDPSDNSSVIFAKGHNLRPARLSNPSSFECLFSWDFAHPKYSISSEVLFAAQEIFRCRTPLSILQRLAQFPSSNFPFVSVRFKSHGTIPLPSIARPEPLSPFLTPQRQPKNHQICVCTMLHNQARFLKEWIIYHSLIGVEHWFIYDNNSDDELEQVVNLLSSTMKLGISIHEWPWTKTQEAGFAHCALRSRESCEWVAFIDVDEFLYLLPGFKIHDVLYNYSKSPSVAELRTTCHSFGPSGRKTAPPEGVTVGYTCRISRPERHKSIVRPEALSPSLINSVHHFHLKNGMKYVNVDKRVMLINHYKYQAWEVFKEKFYRRVATYVADWQDDENVGSKDRAPGLGTKAVEPTDWANRFCDVNDTRLKDYVLRAFADPSTGYLPW